MTRAPKPFASEVELCARFIENVGPDWIAYAETAGWDILLVRKADGFQIGIEAKLKLNALVLTQALEEYGSWSVEKPGPDCRAVLVPESEQGYDRIAAYIGVTVLRVHSPNARYLSRPFYPSLPIIGKGYVGGEESWYEWAPAQRHRLPEYVPDVPAGASAPTQLTDWKIGALKIAVTLEKRGYVTRADFKHIQIDHRRWLASGMGWLTVENGRYVKGPYLPNFKAQHPIVYEQIAADADRWMLKEGPVAAKQEELL